MLECRQSCSTLQAPTAIAICRASNRWSSLRIGFADGSRRARLQLENLVVETIGSHDVMNALQ
jgi:hypothetical protein